MSKRLFFGILLSLWSVTAICTQPLGAHARISLLTCSPGEELYARYGHTAIRVEDPNNQLDIVFNYGIFNFYTEHFYWKFMRGETYYQLGIEQAEDFFLGYAYRGRQVYEQVLQLTPTQRQAIFDALATNYRPENRHYLYNFVFDNCATRPYLLIRQALGDTLYSSYQGAEGQTYRSFLRHYTRPASWANFGINLLFGPKADRPMYGEERLFLPEELMFYLSQAHLPDGNPLVEKNKIAHFEIAHVPWYATWYFGIGIWVLLLIAISVHDRQRGKWSWWLEVVMGIIYLIILLIVAFLTFFSLHPLVGFGWRLLVLPTIHLCTRFIYILR